MFLIFRGVLRAPQDLIATQAECGFAEAKSCAIEPTVQVRNIRERPS